MARSYVDEWPNIQALTKHSSRNNEETNTNINRTQASGPEHNNGQKPNQYRNKDNSRNYDYTNKNSYRNRDNSRRQDNIRKRKRSSDDDQDAGYGSYYINEVGDKVYKKARNDFRNQRVNSFAIGAKDDRSKKAWHSLPRVNY